MVNRYTRQAPSIKLCNVQKLAVQCQGSNETNKGAIPEARQCTSRVLSSAPYHAVGEHLYKHVECGACRAAAQIEPCMMSHGCGMRMEVLPLCCISTSQCTEHIKAYQERLHGLCKLRSVFHSSNLLGSSLATKEILLECRGCLFKFIQAILLPFNKAMRFFCLAHGTQPLSFWDLLQRRG